MKKGIVLVVVVLMVGCVSRAPSGATLPTTHKAQRGEFLAQIAEKYYGKGNRSRGVKAIVSANPWLGKGPGIQRPTPLAIPKLEQN